MRSRLGLQLRERACRLNNDGNCRLREGDVGADGDGSEGNDETESDVTTLVRVDRC